jgi:hypothetical protein
MNNSKPVLKLSYPGATEAFLNWYMNHGDKPGGVFLHYDINFALCKQPITQYKSLVDAIHQMFVYRP